MEPTFAARFECKYFVPFEMAPEIRQFIDPFVQPDEFAARHEGFRYPVCSLYLDSPDLCLYQQTVAGEKERFKLRIRAYDDDPDSRVFCEVKSKINSIVHKRRVGLPRAAATACVDHSAIPTLESPKAKRDLAFFVHLMQRVSARPVVRVKYDREAYQSTGMEPARITIDTDLRHAISLDVDYSHESGRWVATPTDGAIVEIKFTERFPSWIHDLVRAFGLKQQPVPKYVLSVDHMMSEGRESALQLADFCLPPRRVG